MLIFNNYSKSNFCVSVKNNTNKVISSSEDSFAGLRPGSYIKLGDDDILYPISKSQKFLYSNSFQVVNSKLIKINANVSTLLQLEDEIDIIYGEYELSIINNIVNYGNDYQENDILTIMGGQTVIDISNGIPNPAQINVDSLDNSNISYLSIKEPGRYFTIPINPVKLTGSKNGNGCEIECIFSPKNNKSILKRTIKSINILPDNTSEIGLDYSLPLGLNSGNISVHKWEIILSSNYLGENLYGVNYVLIKNMTPNYNIPLMVKNSLSADTIYNKGVFIIDKEINLLKSEIDKLKSYLKI